MKTNTAAITGLRIRYDVPTKCTIVQQVLSKSFKSKKVMNQYIDTLASKYAVNPVSIKVWIGKYGQTYKQGINLPAGTMSYVFQPLQGKQIAEVEGKLSELRSKALKIKHKYHPDTTSTPKSLLDELIK